MGRTPLTDSMLEQTGRAIFVALVAYIVQGMALDIQNLKLLWILLGMAAVYGRLRTSCLLYTSDAADERSSVDLGGRRIIKKKKRGRMNAARSISNIGSDV